MDELVFLGIGIGIGIIVVAALIAFFAVMSNGGDRS